MNDTSYRGMTLRDWFAGQALNGLCANPDFWEQYRTTPDPDDANLSQFEFFSREAYLMADAMLVTRQLPPQPL